MVDADPEPPPGPTTPALRASDADRERTADLLREAAGDGRLTIDELDERLHAAYGALTRSDLQQLVADVVVPEGHVDGLTGATGATARVPVRGGAGATRWIVSIMSGSDRAGRWRIDRRCVVLNVMGGSDLDLNDVELADDQVELTVVSIMGGAEIYVPDHMNVRVSNVALMGGNGVTLGDEHPDPGGPVLHLRLISIMGGTDVKRGRKLTRQERRRQRREERRNEWIARRTGSHDGHAVRHPPRDR